MAQEETVEETFRKGAKSLGFDPTSVIEASKEPTPQQTLQVSADTLVTPPKAPTLTPPAFAPPPRTGTADAVARDLDGLITAQTQEAADLRKKRQEFADIGALGTLGEFREQQLAEFGVPENLRELKDIQLQLADIDTASALTETRIEGAAGQTLGQAGREVTQEQRENAVRRTGLAAQAAVLQGNIKTATSLVNDAVNTTFQDRQLQNQNIIAQINDLSGTVDDQTQQLLDQEKVAREADQARVQEVKDAVSDAMNSGAATSQEVAQLTDINATDEDRLALAQSITARGATADRSLDRAVQLAELEKARRASTTVIDRGDGRKQLINSQTGEVIATYGEGELTSVVPFSEQSPTAEASAQIGVTLVDDLKTHEGLNKAVGPSKLGRFTPLKVDVLSGDVADFVASVAQLTGELTLDKLVQKKAEGATFGALSNAELFLLADSATKISKWERNKDGDKPNAEKGETVAFYEVAETDFKEELDKISNFRKLDFVLKGGNPESVGVQQMDDGTFWSINSDGSFTKIR